MSDAPPLIDLLNMSADEIYQWSQTPTSALASTDRGRAWQRQLADGEPMSDTERRALRNTLWRHIRCVELNGFGKTKGRGGLPGRWICLKNLGHDPERPSMGVDLTHHARAWKRRTEQ